MRDIAPEARTLLGMVWKSKYTAIVPATGVVLFSLPFVFCKVQQTVSLLQEQYGLANVATDPTESLTDTLSLDQQPEDQPFADLLCQDDACSLGLTALGADPDGSGSPGETTG